MEIIHSLVITGSPMGEGESPMATPKLRPFLQKNARNLPSGIASVDIQKDEQSGLLTTCFRY